MKHISYLSFYESPIGIIRINTSNHDVISITFVEKSDNSHENALSIKIKNELEAYFKGELKAFSFYNYLSSGLEKQVLEIISHIPYGSVMTYKEIAKLLGDENIISPVINIVNNNPFPILLPCHRVVSFDNSLIDYVGGITKKEFLLEFEKNNNCK